MRLTSGNYSLFRRCPCLYVCSHTAAAYYVQVKKEKADLENKLETEQAYIVNSLKKQVGGSTVNFTYKSGVFIWCLC